MRSVILIVLLVLVAVNAVPDAEQKGNEPVRTPLNVIETPIVCKPGFQPDKNGVCREVWNDPTN